MLKVKVKGSKVVMSGFGDDANELSKLSRLVKVKETKGTNLRSGYAEMVFEFEELADPPVINDGLFQTLVEELEEVTKESDDKTKQITRLKSEITRLKKKLNKDTEVE